MWVVEGGVRQLMHRENSTVAQRQQISGKASKITLPERNFYNSWGIGIQLIPRDVIFNIELAQKQYKDTSQKDGKGH